MMKYVSRLQLTVESFVMMETRQLLGRYWLLSAIASKVPWQL